MKRNLIILLISIVAISGCEVEATKGTYIKTERGLLSFSYGYCHLGMLTNNHSVNILDEDSKPIACYGYVKLTAVEAENYQK